jgi:hypothetical protein
MLHESRRTLLQHLNKRKLLHVKGHGVKGDEAEWKEMEMVRHENANRLWRETLPQENIYTLKRGI